MAAVHCVPRQKCDHEGRFAIDEYNRVRKARCLAVCRNRRHRVVVVCSELVGLGVGLSRLPVLAFLLSFLHSSKGRSGAPGHCADAGTGFSYTVPQDDTQCAA